MRVKASATKELGSSWGDRRVCLRAPLLHRSNTIGRLSIPCGASLVARAEINASGIGGGVCTVLKRENGERPRNQDAQNGAMAMAASTEKNALDPPRLSGALGIDDTWLLSPKDRWATYQIHAATDA